MKKFIVGVAAFAISLGLGGGFGIAQGQQQNGQYPANDPYYGQQSAPPPGQYDQQSEQMGQSAAPPPPQYGQQNGQYGPPQNGQQPYGGPQYGPQGGQQAGPPPQGDQSQASDAAAPGMARLSLIIGDVSTQRGDNGDWVAATVNTPIAVDDRVATSNNGRTELQLDSADVLRMSASATAKVANLSRTNIQLQIGQGLVTYSVLRGSEANSEIDTPNAALHPNGPGQFRILVNSDAETQITVRQGSADVSTPQGSTHVDAGQLITVAGTDNPQYKTENAPGRDDWDTWNNDRDKRIESAASWHDTDRYYTGTEDLDANGTWTEVPDYGQVWVPAQGPDWAPYRDGRWVYEPYYGWTWVSYESWGWAPYHYGRWFMYDNSWAWWPGPVYGYPGYYPIWSPAYVSFFGFGGGGFGFGIGFGFGGGFGRFGWLPVGPGDWYHPWYGRYGGRSNFASVGGFRDDHQGFGPLAGNRGRQFSNVGEAMSNDRVRSGISSMSGSDFGRSAVSAHQSAISAASFRQASLVSGRMPVTPSRESYSPSGREASASAIRNAAPSSQHFFNGSSRAIAGVGASNGAARTQSSFDGNRGFSGSSAAVNSGRTNGAVSSQSSRPGWRTFTPPSSASSANTGRSTQTFEQQNNRSAVNNSSVNATRGETSSPARESTQSNGRNWQTFTPPSRSEQQSQQTERGAASQSYSRQQLNMRQPVVTPRSNYSAPRQTYSAPRQNYSAPSRPSYSAPRQSYSAPRGSSGGGSHSSGGGGGHSGHR
jgi:hypothetical protein